MPINATCPHCKQSFTVPDSAAGKRFKCRNCSQPMDVPAAPVVAAVEAGDDTGIDDDDDDDRDDEDEADEDEADEDEGDADGDADEDEAKDEDESGDNDAPAGEKKLSARERLKLKREGKDKKGKDEQGNDEGGQAKPSEKKAAFTAPNIEMGPAPDPSKLIGQALGSLQRALHPSRVLTAAIGTATVLVVGAVIAALGSLIPVAIVQLLLMLVAGLVVAVGLVVVAVSVAKVDLAALRGEPVPGPMAALLSSIGGGIGSVISVILLGLLVVALILAEGIVCLLTLIPYAGSVVGGALLIGFFFVDLAILLCVPLVMWLTIPLAARSGANPIAPLKGAIARVRREPARILISYIMFIVMSQLVLGVIFAICAGAAVMSGATVNSVRMMVWPGVLGFPGAFFFDMLFVGAGAAIVAGIVLSLPMSAYICSGCQEIHDHPDPE
jgi:hypothetical protein